MGSSEGKKKTMGASSLYTRAKVNVNRSDRLLLLLP